MVGNILGMFGKEVNLDTSFINFNIFYLVHDVFIQFVLAVLFLILVLSLMY